VEELFARVDKLSRRSLFGLTGKIGLALGVGSIGAAVSGVVQPLVAFAQGCISCIGGCVCAPSGGTGLSCCTGVDPNGVGTRCCVVVYSGCARPIYFCSSDSCTGAAC